MYSFSTLICSSSTRKADSRIGALDTALFYKLNESTQLYRLIYTIKRFRKNTSPHIVTRTAWNNNTYPLHLHHHTETRIVYLEMPPFVNGTKPHPRNKFH